MKKQLSTAPIDSGGETVKIETDTIPDYVAVNIAQCLFREVHEAMNDPKWMEDYLRWKNEREE